jgi:hypothetical protein
MLVVRQTLRISVCVSERTHLLQYPFKLLIHCRKARQTLLEVSKFPNHNIRALTSSLILNFKKLLFRNFYEITSWLKSMLLNTVQPASDGFSGTRRLRMTSRSPGTTSSSLRTESFRQTFAIEIVFVNFEFDKCFFDRVFRFSFDFFASYFDLIILLIRL